MESTSDCLLLIVIVEIGGGMAVGRHWLVESQERDDVSLGTVGQVSEQFAALIGSFLQHLLGIQCSPALLIPLTFEA